MTKEQNWPAIEEVWDSFIIDYKTLHLEVVKIYLKLFPEKNPLVESFQEAKKQASTEECKEKSNEIKPLENIVINSEVAIRDFGETFFENSTNYIIDNYTKIRDNLENDYKEKKVKELHMITQTLKTTVRYIINI